MRRNVPKRHATATHTPTHTTVLSIHVTDLDQEIDYVIMYMLLQPPEYIYVLMESTQSINVPMKSSQRAPKKSERKKEYTDA